MLCLLRRVLVFASVLATTLAAGGCGGGGAKSPGGASPKVTYTTRPTITVSQASSSMEPTIHCATPGAGCQAAVADGLVVQPIAASALKRGDIVLFRTPAAAAVECGAGGRFVKRLIGLPRDTVHEDGQGYLSIDGKRLRDPYVDAAHRLADTTDFGRTWRVPRGEYFFVGDNRAQSCDSRMWGSVPAANIIGIVVKIIRSR